MTKLKAEVEAVERRSFVRLTFEPLDRPQLTGGALTLYPDVWTELQELLATRFELTTEIVGQTVKQIGGYDGESKADN